MYLPLDMMRFTGRSHWRLARKRFQYSVIKQNITNAIFIAPFTRALGWDVPRVGRFVENARKDLMNRNYHSHHRFYCVFGRKPEKGDI